MKKIIIGIILAGVTLLGATGASASPSGWAKWGARSSPTFDKMDATYNKIGAALVDDNAPLAESLFRTYSAESIAFSKDANSPSKAVNQDVRDVAIVSVLWVDEGESALSGGATLSAFTMATNSLIRELNKLNRALTVYE